MALTVKETDAWPAGMVTVGGTVALVGSLLARVTTSGSVVSVFRVTVAVAVAPLSTAATREAHGQGRAVGVLEQQARVGGALDEDHAGIGLDAGGDDRRLVADVQTVIDGRDRETGGFLPGGDHDRCRERSRPSCRCW